MGSCLAALEPPAPLQVHCLYEKQTIENKKPFISAEAVGQGFVLEDTTKSCTDWRGFADLCFVTESCYVNQAEPASVS